jgi:GGDEF domain-containing protein
LRYLDRRNTTKIFTLISAADKALFFAKENGGNQLAWAKEAE